MLSYLLGVLTDLARVLGICPHLHHTPTSWFPPHLFPGPWPRGIDPRPLLLPVSTVMSTPTSPFSEVSLAWPGTGQPNLQLSSPCLCRLCLGIKGSRHHDQLWSPFNSPLDVHVPTPPPLQFISSNGRVPVSRDWLNLQLHLFPKRPLSPPIDPLIPVPRPLCHISGLRGLLCAPNRSLISVVLSDPMGGPTSSPEPQPCCLLFPWQSLTSLALPHSDAHPMPLFKPASGLSFIL